MRVAVVNGKVCREGEEVFQEPGVKIKSIQADGVVFQHGDDLQTPKVGKSR